MIMTKWKVYFTDEFKKSFLKLDKNVQKIIKHWINNRLINIDDPRTFGKPLVGDLKNYWRYRIGDYRLIVRINNNELIILLIDIGHRKKIYK